LWRDSLPWLPTLDSTSTSIPRHSRFPELLLTRSARPFSCSATLDDPWGAGSRNLDASLFKDFRLRELLTMGNAAFGKLSGSQTVGRQVQFGLKLVW